MNSIQLFLDLHPTTRQFFHSIVREVVVERFYTFVPAQEASRAPRMLASLQRAKLVWSYDDGEGARFVKLTDQGRAVARHLGYTVEG